jgi:hypothetical protein
MRERVFEWLGWIEKHRVLAAWIVVALIVLLLGYVSWQATDRAGAKKHPKLESSTPPQPGETVM